MLLSCSQSPQRIIRVACLISGTGFMLHVLPDTIPPFYPGLKLTPTVNPGHSDENMMALSTKTANM